MDPHRTEEIIGRIRAWLDTWPDDEPLPPELDPSLVDSETAPPDLASLSAAVTSCSREMKQQGRSFKRLEESIVDIAEVPAQIEARLGQEANNRTSEESQALGDLLDLHERLARSLIESQRTLDMAPRWARWGAAGKAMASIVQGIAMLHDRGTEALSRLDVRTFETDGKKFDPSSMRAVDQVPASPSSPPDTVATTVRRGYIQGERLLRPAEVSVARD